MRRWLTGAAVLALLAVGPEARALQERAFEAVPSGSWTYGVVQRLERAGYFTGSPDATFDGKRRLTRYEFAVAVERLYRSLQPRVLDATVAGSLRGDLNALRRLLQEFSPEIAGLGVDVAELRRQVATMDERLSRLPAGSLEPAAPLLSTHPRTFGLRRALEKPLLYKPLVDERPQPGVGDRPAPSLPAFTPGFAAALGPARLGFDLRRSDLPGSSETGTFTDPAARLDYRAQLSLPLGRALVTAFYEHEGELSDRHDFWIPYFRTGPLEGVGGALTADFSNLNLRLVAAKLQPQDDDFARLLYFKGGVSYRLGGGFSLGLGYERTWLDRPGWATDFSTYTAGIGRSFGRNAELQFLYRYMVPSKGLVDSGAATDVGTSSAITQISVRF